MKTHLISFKLLLMLAYLLANACYLSAGRLTPALREAEFLYNSGSEVAAKEKALSVHNYFPQNFEAILILLKIDFKTENYKDAKKWLKLAHSMKSSHPIVKEYTSILQDIEYRYGPVSNDFGLIKPNVSDMQTAKDFKRAWFGPNFPIISSPSHSLPIEVPNSVIVLPVENPEKDMNEKVVFKIAQEAMDEKRYMKAYLFFAQLLESKPQHRGYRIGKANASFHMKRYVEAIELLSPYVLLSPKSFTSDELSSALNILNDSRKYVYDK